MRNREFVDPLNINVVVCSFDFGVVKLYTTEHMILSLPDPPQALQRVCGFPRSIFEPYASCMRLRTLKVLDGLWYVSFHLKYRAKCKSVSRNFNYHLPETLYSPPITSLD